MTKKQIIDIIEREYAYTSAERAASLLHAQGVSAGKLTDLKISDTKRIAVLNELHIIEYKKFKSDQRV